MLNKRGISKVKFPRLFIIIERKASYSCFTKIIAISGSARMAIVALMGR